MIINDKAEGLMADGCKNITVFLAPKVLLVQQVFTQSYPTIRKHATDSCSVCAMVIKLR